MVKPLTECKMRFDDRDEADFLTEEGQLKYDLDVEVEEFKFFGVNVNVILAYTLGSTPAFQNLWDSPPPRTLRGFPEGIQYRYFGLRDQHCR